MELILSLYTHICSSRFAMLNGMTWYDFSGRRETLKASEPGLSSSVSLLTSRWRDLLMWNHLPWLRRRTLQLIVRTGPSLTTLIHYPRYPELKTSYFKRDPVHLLLLSLAIIIFSHVWVWALRFLLWSIIISKLRIESNKESSGSTRPNYLWTPRPGWMVRGMIWMKGKY